MTRTTVVLALVILFALAAGAGAATVDARSEEPAPAATSAPASTAPDAEVGDPSDEPDATPEGPLPGTGDRTSVLIGAALIVAAFVHWRLTAPRPRKD